MSHRSVRLPTDEEHAELERMTAGAVGRVAMRAHMVLLSARGFSAPEIAHVHDCAKVTVYKWMDRFNEEGPSGLYDRQREGRPRKFTQEAEEELERVLETSPPEAGYDFGCWTAPRLARHLEKRLGTRVHPETVRRALRRLRFSWKRPRRSLPKDPRYKERLSRVVQAVATAGATTTVLFEDETELRRFPPLRRAWMPAGTQQSVKVPKQNGKFCLYGALDIRTGEVFTAPYPKSISAHTKAFVERLLSCVEGKVLLIWDRARWHTSQAVEELIGSHDRLEVVLLPKRAPEANPMEDLWRELKNAVAANLERNLEALRAVCRRFSGRLSSHQALKTAGLRAH